MDVIYLDACSTTTLDPEVRALLVDRLSDNLANPASQHQPGQYANRLLEQTRQQIRSALAIPPRDPVIFVSGGTEANNLALFGICGSAFPDSPDGPRPNIVVSAIEHPSVMGAAAELGSRGWEIRYMGVDANGVTRSEQLAELIDEQTQLVSLMLVNNETGVIQPVIDVARSCAEHGIPVHCDAVQAIGKIPVRFDELATAGVATMTICAHKIHGPRGIGALIVHGQDRKIQPILFGGFQQMGLRPGTEDVALASGFARAVEKACNQQPEDNRNLESLRNSFEWAMRSAFPDVTINGLLAPRAPHCSSLAFPGDETLVPVERQPLMLACDVAGVAISTGSACASGSSDPSHVLQAMNLDQRQIDGSIRVSFSRFNTGPECGLAAERIINAVKHLRRRKSGRI